MSRRDGESATASQPDGPQTGSRGEVGMRISPEVVLLIGGAVLTAALFAVFIPFLAKVWREDSAERNARAQARRRDGTP